jgi:hypothetical protein
MVNDVTLGRNKIADLHIRHIFANPDDIAAEFVTDDDWRLDASGCPRIPVVDVKVRAADRGGASFEENVVVTDSRDGHLAELKAGSGLGFDDCLHHCGHGIQLDLKWMR